MTPLGRSSTSRLPPPNRYTVLRDFMDLPSEPELLALSQSSPSSTQDTIESMDVQNIGCAQPVSPGTPKLDPIPLDGPANPLPPQELERTSSDLPSRENTQSHSCASNCTAGSHTLLPNSRTPSILVPPEFEHQTEYFDDGLAEPSEATSHDYPNLYHGLLVGKRHRDTKLSMSDSVAAILEAPSTVTETGGETAKKSSTSKIPPPAILPPSNLHSTAPSNNNFNNTRESWRDRADNLCLTSSTFNGEHRSNLETTNELEDNGFSDLSTLTSVNPDSVSKAQQDLSPLKATVFSKPSSQVKGPNMSAQPKRSTYMSREQYRSSWGMEMAEMAAVFKEPTEPSQRKLPPWRLDVDPRIPTGHHVPHPSNAAIPPSKTPNTWTARIRNDNQSQQVDPLSVPNWREKNNNGSSTYNSKRMASTSPPLVNRRPEQKRRQKTTPEDRPRNLQRVHEQKLSKPPGAKQNASVSTLAPQHKEPCLPPSPKLKLTLKGKEKEITSTAASQMLDSSQKGSPSQEHNALTYHKNCSSSQYYQLAKLLRSQDSVNQNETKHQDGHRSSEPPTPDLSPPTLGVLAPCSIRQSEYEEQQARNNRKFAWFLTRLNQGRTSKQTQTTRFAPDAAAPSHPQSQSVTLGPFPLSSKGIDNFETARHTLENSHEAQTSGEDEDNSSMTVEAGGTGHSSPIVSSSPERDGDFSVIVDEDAAKPDTPVLEQGDTPVSLWSTQAPARCTIAASTAPMPASSISVPSPEVRAPDLPPAPAPAPLPYIYAPLSEPWIPVRRSVLSPGGMLDRGYGVIRAIVYPSKLVNYYEESTQRLIKGVDEYNKFYGGLDFVVMRYQIGDKVDEGIRVLSACMTDVIKSLSSYEGSDEEDMIPPHLRHNNDVLMPFAESAVSRIPCYPNAIPSKSESAGLWCNNTFLYHHRKQLIENKDGRIYMQALVHHLAHDSLLAKEFELCSTQFGQGLVCTKTAPFLFHPGQFALANTLRMPAVDSAVAVSKVAWDNRLNQATVTCWNWWFEPDRLSRGEIQYTITFPPRGVVNIRDLNIYPLLTPDLSDLSDLPLPEKALVNEYLSAGEKVWDLIQQPTLIEYSGYDLQHRFYPRGSRFVIDYNLRRYEVPGISKVTLVTGESGPGIRYTTQEPKNPHDPYPDYIKLHFNGTNKPSRLLLLLMPPCITACSLQNKEQRWCSILTSKITVPTCDISAVDRLLLLPATKIDLTTLSRSYQSALNPRGRLMIPPKPLVLHFHGDEGRGKTDAARAVAEMLHAPLLIPDLSWMLTADITTFSCASDFYRTAGARWGGVLLLDEADYWVCDASAFGCQDNDDHVYEIAYTRLKTLLDSYLGIVILITRTPVRTKDLYINRRITLSIDFDDQFIDFNENWKLWWKILQEVANKDENFHLDLLQVDSSKVQELICRDLCMDLNGHQISDVIEAAWMNARRIQGEGLPNTGPVYLRIGHIEEALKSLCGEVWSDDLSEDEVGGGALDGSASLSS